MKYLVSTLLFFIGMQLGFANKIHKINLPSFVRTVELFRGTESEEIGTTEDTPTTPPPSKAVIKLNEKTDSLNRIADDDSIKKANGQQVKNASQTNAPVNGNSNVGGNNSYMTMGANPRVVAKFNELIKAANTLKGNALEGGIQTQIIQSSQNEDEHCFHCNQTDLEYYKITGDTEYSITYGAFNAVFKQVTTKKIFLDKIKLSPKMKVKSPGKQKQASTSYSRDSSHADTVSKGKPTNASAIKSTKESCLTLISAYIVDTTVIKRQRLFDKKGDSIVLIKSVRDTLWFNQVTGRDDDLVQPDCSGPESYPPTRSDIKALARCIRYGKGGLRAIVGIGGGPSFAMRELIVNNSQFANNGNYTLRRNNEWTNYGGAANLYLGLAKNGNYICLDGFFIQQGFASSNATEINWNTGLLGDQPANNPAFYQLHLLGLGLEYSYRPYFGKVMPVITGGLYYLHGFNKGLSATALGDSIYSQQGPVNAGGMKLAIGISYRPSYLVELRFQPDIYYDFRFVRSSDIKTRFYNPGFEVSLMFNCFGHLKGK